MDIHDLVSEGFELKKQISEKQSRLKEIQAQLVGVATFPEGKHTAIVHGNGIFAKVTNRIENIWDQQKLNAARAMLGDESFLSIFGFEWKAKSKKDINGFLAHAPQDKRQPILDALTVKTTQSVSFDLSE